MSKILKNTTINPITIRDTGITIFNGIDYTIPATDYPLWAASIDIDAYINANTIVVNDGYDDLKPVNALRHLHEEGLVRDSAFLGTTEVHETSNVTEILNASSRLVHIFTGTVSGQILRFGDARTYNVGQHYKVWNTSTTNVIVQDNVGNIIATLPPFTVIPMATLKDNSTQAGVWLISINNIVTGLGTSATLTYTRNGGVSQGAYLYVGQALTSFAGYIINGSNYITKLSASNSSAMASNRSATFRLRRRTGVSTFVDIPGTDITIPSNAYAATVTNLLVPIGPDWEISAYRISSDGNGSVNNLIMNVFTVPQ